mmetsp:Transcript_72485/g.169821  ORF Transcript_72485/g.169821 Transcript_72485/m.169821 type:complete len:527 (-) Transcript_72485:76-1656(-)
MVLDPTGQRSSAASGPRKQAACLRPTPEGRRREEALFAIMDKLLRAAANSAQQRNLKNAATHLRRAHQIASKRADEGLLAGRVARACVGVHYCGLLSRFGCHTQALQEALNAVVEAEEVWSMIGRASVEASAPLSRKAICAVVQAKHCVAIELEYSLSQEGPDHVQMEAAAVRDNLIPSLHQEAAALAAELPKGHPIRELSERTEAQEAARRGVTFTAGASRFSDPWGLAEQLARLPEPDALEDDATAEPDIIQEPPVEGLDRNSRPPSAHSVLSRPTSAVKLQRLEDQALPPPDDALRYPPSGLMPPEIPAEEEPFPERLGSRASVLWDPARERLFSRGSSKASRASRASSKARAGSKSAQGDRRLRRVITHEVSPDMFQEWVQQNEPKHVKGSVNQRIATEAGLSEVKFEMQTQSRRFHMHEIPRFSPEDLYENKVLYSHYGVKVRSQAAKKEEKGVPPGKRGGQSPSSSGSMKALADQLLHSHENSEFAKEFFEYVYGYGTRGRKTLDVFEGLRQAYKSSKAV